MDQIPPEVPAGISHSVMVSAGYRITKGPCRWCSERVVVFVKSSTSSLVMVLSFVEGMVLNMTSNMLERVFSVLSVLEMLLQVSCYF